MHVFMARRVLSSWIVLPITKLSKLASESDSGNPLRPLWNWRHRCRLPGLRTSMELDACFPRSFLFQLSTWWGKTKLSFSPSPISNEGRDIGKVVGMTVNRVGNGFLPSPPTLPTVRVRSGRHQPLALSPTD